VDAALGARLAKLRPLRPLLRATGAFRLDWSDAIEIHDLRRPFPWPDASAVAIYSSHTLEHLSKRDGARFLDECARVLAPGGVLRIAVPDLARVIADYEKGELPAVDLIDRLGVSWSHPDDGWLKRLLAPWVRFPHRCMYDAPALLAALRERGLSAQASPPLLSRIRDVAEVECPERVRDSVIAEAVKPA
jgi:SAM-dependent methyltransferase